MSLSFEDSGTYHKSAYEKEPRWDEKIAWFEIPDDNEAHLYRLVASPYYYAQHWIQSRKKDGTSGKPFPVGCKNYDPAHGKFFENGCKVCLYLDSVRKYLPEKRNDWPQNIARLSRNIVMAQNTIIREIQAAGAPPNKPDWTFIHPVRFGGTVQQDLDAKISMNKGPDGQTYSFNHKDFGKDFYLKYSSQIQDPKKRYSLNLEGRTPLSDVELSHGKYLVDFGAAYKPTSDASIDDALLRFGYLEFADNLLASKKVQQIRQDAQAQAAIAAPAAAPAAAAPALAAPAAAPAAALSPGQQVFADVKTQQAAQAAAPAPSGFDLPAVAAPAPAAPDLAEPANWGAPAAAAAPAVTAPVVAPPVVTAPPVQVEQPLAPPPAAPAQQAAPATVQAAPAAAPSGDAMQAFATTNKLDLAVQTKTFTSQFQKYQAGMTVPVCFGNYPQNFKPYCKQCPVRLDCMIAE